MLPIIDFPFIGRVYTYPLFLGFALAFLFTNIEIINEKKNILGKKDLRILFLVTCFNAYIGAKFLFYLSTGTLSFNFFIDKSFWLGGGLVFYGGYIFGFVTLFLFFKLKNRKGSDFLPFLPYVIFTHSIGRLGCFFSGCCFGGICPISLFDRWPTQIIEACFLLLLGFYIKKQISEGKFFIFNKYVFLYATFRFVIEFFRGDDIRGLWLLTLSTSQIISVVLIFFAGACYLKESFSTKSSDT